MFVCLALALSLSLSHSFFHTHTHTNRHTHIHTNRYTNRHTNRHTHTIVRERTHTHTHTDFYLTERKFFFLPFLLQFIYFFNFFILLFPFTPISVMQNEYPRLMWRNCHIRGLYLRVLSFRRIRGGYKTRLRFLMNESVSIHFYFPFQC